MAAWCNAFRKIVPNTVMHAGNQSSRTGFGLRTKLAGAAMTWMKIPNLFKLKVWQTSPKLDDMYNSKFSWSQALLLCFGWIPGQKLNKVTSSDLPAESKWRKSIPCLGACPPQSTVNSLPLATRHALVGRHRVPNHLQLTLRIPCHWGLKDLCWHACDRRHRSQRRFDLDPTRTHHLKPHASLGT